MHAIDCIAIYSVDDDDTDHHKVCDAFRIRGVEEIFVRMTGPYLIIGQLSIAYSNQS
jgi:hypothetical protein